MLAACSSIQSPSPSAGHIRAEGQVAATSKDIPAPVTGAATLTRPKASAKAESYSVSVRNIPVQDLLFALSRDAKLNVDIHPGINGIVTLNAIDQTLQQILTRIGKQVDMRWELDGPNLVVMPDSPFLRTYKVDYVNMSRDVSGTVSINTQIASTSSGVGTTGATGGGGNNSSTSVTSTAKNHFWDSLEKNVKDILRESDKILPEGSSETVIERSDQQATTGTGAQGGQPSNRAGSSATSLAGSPNPANLQQQGTTVVKRTTFREAASVIVNSEAGIVVVRATGRQHEKVQDYLDQILTNSKRQVMIEATIAEISLSDQYQQGINWQSLKVIGKGSGTEGVLTAIQNPSGLTAATSTSKAVFDTASVSSSNSIGGLFLNFISEKAGISTTLKLLETFGNVKVLSSPKISVLNNQTALLKVVDNLVYFEVKSDSTTTTTGTNKSTTTTAKSVAVGMVMSVTPQVGESDLIILNVRPSISRLKGYKTDPNPDIPVNTPNLVPEIQTREMESMLRLTNGETAVMGGLMSDELNNTTDAIPGLSKIPGIGTLFTTRNDVTKKTELVIFLKPTIIRDPSINGDYRGFRDQLPGKDYFANNPGPEPKQFNMQGTDAR
jgi:general secretion pathway protein D